MSLCPASGRPVRLTATPQGVDDLNPPGAVASLRLPGPTTRTETVQRAICAYGHFFVDRERAANWPCLRPEALLLSVADADHLARAIADAAREYAQRAQI